MPVIFSSGGIRSTATASLAPVLRQIATWDPGPGNHGGESSHALSFGQNMLAGSSIWVCATGAEDTGPPDPHTPGTTFSVTDTASNTYNPEIDYIYSGAVGLSNMGQSYCLTPTALTTSDTIRVTWSAFGDYHGILIAEVTGATQVLDHVSNTQTHSGTTTDSLTPGTVALANKAALILAVFYNSDNGDAPPVPGTGFTDGGTLWQWDFAGKLARFESRQVSAGTASMAVTATPATANSDPYPSITIVFGP